MPEVFGFVSDLENLPKWYYFVVQVKKIFPGRVGVGSEFHQQRKSDEQVLRIGEFEPPSRLTVVSVAPSSPELHRTMVFLGDSHSTRTVDTWRLERGISPLLRLLGKARVSSAVKANLAELKELLESGHTTLQDGRVTSA